VASNGCLEFSKDAISAKRVQTAAPVAVVEKTQATIAALDYLPEMQGSRVEPGEPCEEVIAGSGER
jgi:hypothetical protein